MGFWAGMWIGGTVVSAIHMWWDWVSHLNWSHFLIRLQCLYSVLNILMVPLQQELRTVLAHPMVIWISESATWSPEVTVPHGICHFICCNVPGYLQGRKSKKLPHGGKKWVKDTGRKRKLRVNSAWYQMQWISTNRQKLNKVIIFRTTEQITKNTKNHACAEIIYKNIHLCIDMSWAAEASTESGWCQIFD